MSNEVPKPVQQVVRRTYRMFGPDENEKATKAEAIERGTDIEIIVGYCQIHVGPDVATEFANKILELAALVRDRT